MKPLFEERMKTLLESEEDFSQFSGIIHEAPLNFIRCNTLKITPEKLLDRLQRDWDVSTPFLNFPEIILVKSKLGPGELGNRIEHLLGFYYIQEISSMMSVLALEPKPDELVLDLFASPGSKTTQMASYMKNRGTIIANDLKIERIKILSSNLDKAGATNTIITRKDAPNLCKELMKSRFQKFDKILIDAPCSGEGTLRSSPKTLETWNFKVIKKLSREQKKFLALAVPLLIKGGTLVYSTCTHAPEENEEIISFALENFPLKIEKLSLPLKCRAGITNWGGKRFHKGTEKACRIYPQDNDSEGFFVAKFTLMEEVE